MPSKNILGGYFMFNSWIDFITWERDSLDTVDVKKVYIDIAEDVMAGIMLSQIVYWYLPSREGKSKLTIKKQDKKTKDTHFWIAKSRDEWYEEIRFSKNNVITAMKKLEEKQIIFRQDNMFDGKRTAHIRLNFPVFLNMLNEEMAKHKKELNEFEQYLKDEMNSRMTPEEHSIKQEAPREPLSPLGCPECGQPDCHDSGQPIVLNADNPLSGTRTNITKNTSKITTKTKNKNLEEEEEVKSPKLVYKNNFSELEQNTARKFIAPQMYETINDLEKNYNVHPEHMKRIICYMAQGQMKYISTIEYRSKLLEIERNNGKDKKGRKIGDPAYYIVNGILKMRIENNSDQKIFTYEKAVKEQQKQKEENKNNETAVKSVLFYNWLEN